MGATACYDARVRDPGLRVTVRSWSWDPRLVGTLFALALDAALLTFAVVLVVASVSAATGIVITATAGLVLVPLLGWRYGRRVASRAEDRWAAYALRTLLLVDVGFVASVVVFQTLTVPLAGGIGDRLFFAADVALTCAIVVVALTLLVAVPIGLVWTGVMHWAARRRSYP